MMRPYTEYQQSDISWLGKVPKHWTKNKFKFLLNEKPKTQNLELPCGSISFGHVVFKDSERLSEETKAAYQEVLTGEFLVNPLNLNYDLKSLRTALADIDVIVSSGYIVLKSLDVVDKAYLRWLLYLFDVRHMKTLGAGIRQTISFKDIADCAVYIPNDSEQKAIAKFLDRETQRIDSLIGEKQTFIKLLKEKRQALISHVVTKGLNPNVEMQDSGIEWIGQVPKHWNITSLKSVSTVVDPNPSHRNPEYVDNGFPFISTKEFTGIDGIELDTLRRVSEDTVIEQEKRCEFREGSIAFSRKGTIGEVRILPHHIRFALLDSVCVINAGDTVSYQYLYLQAKSSVYDSQLGAVVRGAALKQVSVGKVRDLLTLCPPIDEQNQIVTYIDQQLEKLDKLVAETSTSLALLKERRISLISAAVTGKIDVREAV
ncbi:MAG: restriction endonuclease subunit S [Vibrio sp.]